jgi:acyl-coenzyme A thioesterase PaaI-like protein
MTQAFEPTDSDFRARVKTSFSLQGFMATLGASLELVEPGEVHIGLPFSRHLAQQHGYLHAGATTAIADSANGYAALTLTPGDAEVLAWSSRST